MRLKYFTNRTYHKKT